MEIRNSERLILLMLCEIHKALKIKDGFDADFITAALADGHVWAIKREYGHVLPGNDDQPEQVREVTDILDMWRMLEASYRLLDAEGKKKVTDAAPIFGKKPSFEGFDGNNESEQLSIYEFLVEKMGLWEEFKGRNKNTHMPTLDGYRRMFETYRPMLDSMTLPELSPEQIAAVLNARGA